MLNRPSSSWKMDVPLGDAPTERSVRRSVRLCSPPVCLATRKPSPIPPTTVRLWCRRHRTLGTTASTMTMPNPVRSGCRDMSFAIHRESRRIGELNVTWQLISPSRASLELVMWIPAHLPATCVRAGPCAWASSAGSLQPSRSLSF